MKHSKWIGFRNFLFTSVFCLVLADSRIGRCWKQSRCCEVNGTSNLYASLLICLTHLGLLKCLRDEPLGQRLGAELRDLLRRRIDLTWQHHWVEPVLRRQWLEQLVDVFLRDRVLPSGDSCRVLLLPLLQETSLVLALLHRQVLRLVKLHRFLKNMIRRKWNNYTARKKFNKNIIYDFGILTNQQK